MAKTIYLSEIKALNGKSIRSAEKWKAIRHHKDVKKISMLGVHKDGKTKHEIIFNDKSSIYIFV
jgi:hypothetical protein